MCQKRIFFRNFFIFIGILFWATSCQEEGEVRVVAADNGGDVEMQTGQTLVITLDSNPSTGYAWEVVEFDAARLPLVGEGVYKASSDEDPLLGRGGTETFRFDAEESGVVKLHLIYHRSWEEDVPPLDAFILEVIIK